MDRIDAMQVFVAVADLRGLRRRPASSACRRRRVTRLVAALEDRLGARLLQRTTRSVDPDRCRRSLSGAGEANPWRCRGGRRHRQDERTRPSGRLVVSAPVGLVASCQSGDVDISEALSRGVGRIAAVGSHGQSGGGGRRSRRQDRSPGRLPVWSPAMSARCGGLWSPRRPISSSMASRGRRRPSPPTTPFISAPDAAPDWRFASERPRDPRVPYAAAFHQQRRRRDPLCRSGRRAYAGAGLSGGRR